MAEINIRIGEIDGAIEKLQSLQGKCMSANTNAPISVGGGRSVERLEDMADTYKKMNVQFVQLISNTIHFLQNVRDSYVASDEKAARGMAGNK